MDDSRTSTGAMIEWRLSFVSFLGNFQSFVWLSRGYRKSLKININNVFQYGRHEPIQSQPYSTKWNLHY